MWIVIDTDKPVNLERGAGSGSVTVNSVGDLILTGTINANSNISLTAGPGSDITQQAGVLNSALGGIALDAGGNVGADPESGADAKRVTVTTPSGVLTVKAGQTAYVEATGAKTLQLAGSAGTLADIVNASSIVNAAGQTFMTPELRLETTGSIGSQTDFFRIGTASGNIRLSVDAAEDVFLRGAASLELEQVASAHGDVHLVTDGSLLDANVREVKDERDISRMEAMWGKLGILAADTAAGQEAQVNAKIDAECAAITATYHQYWNLMSKLNASEYSQVEERASWLAEDATRTEADADAYFASRDTRLAEWVGLLDAFDPSLRQGGHDAAFTAQRAALNAAQLSLLTNRVAGSLWTRDELLGGVTPDIYAGTTTTMRTEEANVVGDRIVLEAGQNIGLKQTGAYTDFTADQLLAENLVHLTEAQKLIIWASEETDRVDLGGGVTRIHQAEDVNVAAGTSLSVRAGGHALIGTGVTNLGDDTSQDLTVVAAVAGGELRVKADEDLVQGTGEQDFVLTAESYNGFSAAEHLVLEASNGSLGVSGNPLLVGGHSGLTARALNDIRLTARPGQDLVVDRLARGEGGIVELSADAALTLNGEHVVVDDLTTLTAQTVNLNGKTVDVQAGATVHASSLRIGLLENGIDPSRARISDEALLGIAPVIVTGSGGANDVLDYADSTADASWEVTADQAGSMTNITGRDVTFTGIEHVFSGSGADDVSVNGDLSTFDTGIGDDLVTMGSGSLGTLTLGLGHNKVVLSDNGYIGLLDGGQGLDTLDASGTTGELAWNIVDNSGALTRGGISLIDDFRSMEHLLGTPGKNSFTLVNSSVTSITTGDGDDTLSMTDSQARAIVLGNGANSMILAGASLDTLDTGDGDDMLILRDSPVGTPMQIGTVNLGMGVDRMISQRGAPNNAWSVETPYSGFASGIGLFSGVESIANTTPGGNFTLKDVIGSVGLGRDAYLTIWETGRYDTLTWSEPVVIVDLRIKQIFTEAEGENAAYFYPALNAERDQFDVIIERLIGQTAFDALMAGDDPFYILGADGGSYTLAFYQPLYGNYMLTNDLKTISRFLNASPLDVAQQYARNLVTFSGSSQAGQNGEVNPAPKIERTATPEGQSSGSESRQEGKKDEVSDADKEQSEGTEGENAGDSTPGGALQDMRQEAGQGGAQ